MAIGDIIVGLDLGASKTCCVVGQVNKFNEIEVIGYGMSSNNSLKRGIIIDHTLAAKSIREAISAAEEISGLSINSAYINAKGMNIRIVNKTIEVEALKPDDALSMADINNLFTKVQMSVMVAENEQIIDILPIEYRVNNRVYKQEPLGCFCEKYEADTEVVIANGDFLEGILRTFKLANLKIDGIILETLATSNIVLMPEEKETGVLMVDIGAGHTDISLYKNSILQYYNTLPVGGNHITNDIALTLDISMEEADKLKRQYNLALKSMIKNNHEIKLNSVASSEKSNIVKCNDVVQIIEARVREIYQLIKRMLAEKGITSRIDCMVLTGQGISNIIGSEELAKEILRIGQVRICSPKLVNVIKAQHTTVFGMVRYIANLGYSKHVNSEVEIVTEPTLNERFSNSISMIFNKLFNRKRIKNTEEDLE